MVNPKIIWTSTALLLVLLALILLGKLVIWTAVAWLFHYSIRRALLIAAGLTQIGEFSYVLAKVARDAKLLSPAIYNAILMASLLSILINVPLVRFAFARMASITVLDQCDL